MLPSWFKQSVTRIRPGVTYSRGSQVPDWANVSMKEISGCSIQPSSSSLTLDGRVLGINESMTLYMPMRADVAVGDRIRYDGTDYTVTSIRAWTSPTGGMSNKQATLERWEG